MGFPIDCQPRQAVAEALKVYPDLAHLNMDHTNFNEDCMKAGPSRDAQQGWYRGNRKSPEVPTVVCRFLSALKTGTEPLEPSNPGTCCWVANLGELGFNLRVWRITDANYSKPNGILEPCNHWNPGTLSVVGLQFFYMLHIIQGKYMVQTTY